MKKDNYFTEEMNQAQKSNENETPYMVDVYIQMVIDEALFKRKKFLVEEKINQALDKKDYESFLHFSEEYNELLKHSIV